MLEIEKEKFKKEGELYLRIKVFPGFPKNKIREISQDGTVKIEICAQPEKGKANNELIKFLSKEFEISKNNIKIISGKAERIKLVKLRKYE